jgi:5-methylcytosine-specific restriction enzyme subunit McrC
MFAYNIYWDTGKSILLYPGSGDLDSHFGNFHKGRPQGNKCKIGFVEVLNENGKLDYEISKSILKKLK